MHSKDIAPAMFAQSMKAERARARAAARMMLKGDAALRKQIETERKEARLYFRTRSCRR